MANLIEVFGYVKPGMERIGQNVRKTCRMGKQFINYCFLAGDTYWLDGSCPAWRSRRLAPRAAIISIGNWLLNLLSAAVSRR